MKKWLMLPLLPLLPLLLVQQEAGATPLTDKTFRSTQTIGTSSGYDAIFRLSDTDATVGYDKMHYNISFTGVDLLGVPPYTTTGQPFALLLSSTSLMQFYILNFADNPVINIVDLTGSNNAVSNVTPLDHFLPVSGNPGSRTVSGNTITGDYICGPSDAGCLDLLKLSGFEEDQTCMQFKGMTGACEDNPAGMKKVSSIPVANSLMLLGIGLMSLLRVPSRRTWLS